MLYRTHFQTIKATIVLNACICTSCVDIGLVTGTICLAAFFLLVQFLFKSKLIGEGKQSRQMGNLLTTLTIKC